MYHLTTQKWDSVNSKHKAHNVHSFIQVLNLSVCAQLPSHVQLFETPWTAAWQTLLSMGFSRQEYWSRFPFPTAGDLPHQRSNPCLLCLLRWQAASLPMVLPLPPNNEGELLITNVTRFLNCWSLERRKSKWLSGNHSSIGHLLCPLGETLFLWDQDL